jgi:hypothetical protein
LWHKIPVFIGGEKSPMLGAIQTFWRKRSAFGGIPDMVRCEKVGFRGHSGHGSMPIKTVEIDPQRTLAAAKPFNDDIFDIYNRAPTGMRVVVL